MRVDIIFITIEFPEAEQDMVDIDDVVALEIFGTGALKAKG